MKPKKKQKLKKILSFLGCFALAFLLCALPFVKSTNTNSASAYQQQLTDKFNPVPIFNQPTSDISSIDLYDENILISNSVDNTSTYNYYNSIYEFYNTSSPSFSITLNYDFNADTIIDYLNNYSNVSTTFNSTDLYSSYIDYYNSLSFVDNYYSVYLSFILTQNSSLFDVTNYSLTLTNKADNTIININPLEVTGTNIFFISKAQNLELTKILFNLSYLSTLDFSNGSLAYVLKNYTLTFNITSSSASSLNTKVYVDTIYNTYLSSNIQDYNDTLTNIVYTKGALYQNLDFANYYLFYSSELSFDYNSYWQEYYSNYYSDSITNSYNYGYDLGYNQGLLDGTETDEVVSKSILSFVSYPFTILSGFLNFNILGFNIYNILLGFITTLLLIWVIKKLN